MLNNKKGQGLSINAIILIILAVVVLVMLILGFTLGWSRILPILPSTSNTDTLVTACNLACSQQGFNDFCNSPRTLNSENLELNRATCDYLAQQHPNLGFQTCSSITCNNQILRENNLVRMFQNQNALDADETVCVENAGKKVYALSNDGKTVLNKLCPVP
jgi:hypothetical protein